MKLTYQQSAANRAMGEVSAGRARSLYNNAGKVWKAAGGNIMSPSKHVSMGQGSSRGITHSPTYRSGLSNYFSF